MCTDTQSKKKLYALLRPHSTSEVSVAIIPESDVASDPRHQLSPQWNLALHRQIRLAMPMRPNPNPRLGFQASIPRVLAPKPSRLGIPKTHPRSWPTT